MSLPVQVLVAYGSHALASSPSYQDITDHCSSINIRRGRQYLTDKTDAGTCDIGFVDKDGALDPTYVSGPYWPMDPNCPAQVYIRNPVTDNLVQIFQGQVQGCPQTVSAQGARANRGTIPLVDLFALLALKEIPPSVDFDSSDTGANTPNATGNTTYAEQTVQDRIKAILADAGVPSGWTDIYSGNVRVQQTTYSPGYSVLAAMQDAADAEWPGLSNLFVMKDGRVAFRGRRARFHWTDYEANTWDVGAAANVATDSTMALLAHDDFVIDRDINKVINNALVTPRGISDADIAGQLYYDSTSITNYGPRSYTAQDLINAGATTGTNAGDPLAECLMFATFFVDNFKTPATRIASATFRPVRPSAANASYHWNFVCNVEIGDVCNMNVQTPHGVGFVGANYFVEGITYDIQLGGKGPGATQMIPNLTMTLDLSPGDFYTDEPADWGSS